MYPPERHREILATARGDGRVDVRSMSRRLAVTPETVRRDLTDLERRGFVKRVYGGAVPVDRHMRAVAPGDLDVELAAEKERIATLALDELPDGGSVFLDGGSTTAPLARMMPTDRGLTVVTNALPTAALLASRPGITLHVVGGLVRPGTTATVGGWAREAISNIHADVAFLGASGISVTHGLTAPDLAEADIKRLLFDAARRTVVLADRTKVGRSDFAHVVAVRRVDLLITDSGVDPELAAQIEAAGPTVLRA